MGEPLPHPKPDEIRSPVLVPTRSDSHGNLILVSVLAALLVASLRFVWNWMQTPHSASEWHKAGSIRIGYAVEAPYAFITPDGRVTGESPEIARVIVDRLGMRQVEWRLVEFGRLIDGLEADEFDVIAAGMFITPEREKRVAFSRPTFQVAPGLLVRKGNPLALHSYSDLLQSTNARVAVLHGSVEEEAMEQLGLPSNRRIQVPDAASGRAAVRSGQADALILSAPTLRWMVMHPISGLTEMAVPFHAATHANPTPPAVGGFAFRKDDTDLLRNWDAELDAFLGSEEHRRLVSQFGFTVAELPPTTPSHPKRPHR